MAHDEDKRSAAEAAVAEIAEGMTVGLGTGSTAAFAIAALARRVAAGLRIDAVATSEATARAAADAGIAVVAMDDRTAIDLAIDGADEIDDAFLAIKGAGGAMLREKVVASAARRFVVIVDASKRVRAIGAAAVPVECPAFAQALVAARLRALEATVTSRGAYRTDNGNAVLDARFGAIADPRALAAAIAAIPGVAAHGLFLDEVDAVYVADRGIVTRLERTRGRG